MSLFTDSFTALYNAQTSATGTALTATVAGVATSKPAIVTESEFIDSFAPGAIAENGVFTIQMLVSDFSSTPADFANVTILSRTLSLLDYKDNNGVRILRVGDPVAQE